jgi:hypothetical protein
MNQAKVDLMHTSESFPTDYRCSLRSLELDEPLFASATETQVYFLLEYARSWGAKALDESDLAEAVKAHLKQALKDIPGARLLLIKGRPGRSASRPRFFAARLSDSHPGLYAFELGSYVELLDLDLPALAAGAAAYASQISPDPLYLICTNGRRDPCCAVNGPAVFRALSRLPNLQVWQTSHLGGHRFAANLVYLPDGLFFGRLDPRSAAEVVAGLQRSELALDHFRGRACYAQPVQAAEYYLRRKTGLLGNRAFHLQTAEQTSAQQWRVIFAASDDTIRYQMEIQRQVHEESFFQSCRQDKLSPLVTHQLLSLHQQPKRR